MLKKYEEKKIIQKQILAHNANKLEKFSNNCVLSIAFDTFINEKNILLLWGKGMSGQRVLCARQNKGCSVKKRVFAWIFLN